MQKKWKNIAISFGSGNRLPVLLKSIISSNKEERENAYSSLENYVVLQSDLYEGAYYVIDPLIKILEDQSQSDKYRPLDLLYEIFCGCATPENIIQIEGGQMVQLTMACRQKVLFYQDRIRNITVTNEKEVKAKNDLLEVMNNLPEMFPTIESALEICRILGIPPSAAGL